MTKEVLQVIKRFEESPDTKEKLEIIKQYKSGELCGLDFYGEAKDYLDKEK